jgi:hypothetical protein
MSNELESVVRPAQTLDYSPARPYYNPGQVGVSNTRLQIGRGGSGKVLSGSYSATTSYYMTEYSNEKTQEG